MPQVMCKPCPFVNGLCGGLIGFFAFYQEIHLD
jgi:hypothetical protein